ncbi:hypothetical protein GCM10017781_42160 [Deinococcus metalli]|uniref:Universal stress protein n=1 Tax=Deinococcus metalli TaxID=1141878 RepID=A0ABQ3JU60_9DEIO|nr:hypothetical protein GCM10017781_42160 [Deinococcus metalli]
MGGYDDPLLHDFALHCAAWHVSHEVRPEPDFTVGTLRSHLQEAGVDAVWLPKVDPPTGRPEALPLLAALVHASPVMVWVSHPASVLPTHLTVAYDGNPHTQEALMVAASLAQSWSLPLHLRLITAQQVPPPGALCLAETSDRLASLGRAPTTAERYVGSAATALSSATGPDTLLIMGTHWPQDRQWAWRDTTMDVVLQAAAGSVLVCPAPDLG